jgi:hypothetical protein
VPDVGEVAGQVDDKSPAEEWRAREGCHALSLLAVYLTLIEGFRVQSEVDCFSIVIESGPRRRVVFRYMRPSCLFSGRLARLF